MRRLLVVGAAAGALLLGAGAGAGPAMANTTDQMVCVDAYTFVNGVCDMGTAQLGQPYEGILDTSAQEGGVFSVTGTVPPGLMVRQQGPVTGTIIGGTPTTQGTFTFTVQGVDNNNVPIAPMTYQLTIGAPPALTVVLPGSGSTLLPGTEGANYAQDFFANGGFPPYAWSVIAGHLPPGLHLASPNPPTSDNELTGTPTAAGTFSFTMQVTDSQGDHAAQRFSLAIRQGGNHQ